ncbi:MAG: hypothetical protein M0R02_00905 [Bacteroidales bacterium]|nr:hypothetical protein [Bacteroidales bacterium]
MKKYILYASLITFLFAACKKEKEYKKFESPLWQEAANSYYTNMTAVFVLPTNIKTFQTDADEIAAFIRDTCRGTAQIIDGKFFITVKGIAHEESEVVFKYYNAKNKYIYESKEQWFFESDAVIGTFDNPITLELNVIQ